MVVVRIMLSEGVEWCCCREAAYSFAVCSLCACLRALLQACRVARLFRRLLLRLPHPLLTRWNWWHNWWHWQRLNQARSHLRWAEAEHSNIKAAVDRARSASGHVVQKLQVRGARF